MTFLSAWRLAFLVAPVALFAAYLLVQRQRSRTSVRFTSVEMLASVAPRRPGWQRHVAAAMPLASLTVMVVAFAQPARAIRTPRQRATVVLVLDTSASMTASDVTPSRLAAAEQGARNFVNALPTGVQVGLESFSSTARMLVAPTSDRTTVLGSIDTLQAGGGTATADALYLALNAISGLPVGADGKAAPAAIVLMSDGSPNIGRGDQTPADAANTAAAAARQAGVDVDTIAYGTFGGVIDLHGRLIPVPADPAAMARIAATNGGHTFTAQTASQLKWVYAQIGRAVGYDVHRRQIAAWFTAAAIALLVAAAVAALIWTQRVI